MPKALNRPGPKSRVLTGSCAAPPGGPTMHVADCKIIPGPSALILHASRHRPSTENPQWSTRPASPSTYTRWPASVPRCSRPQSERRARLSQPRTAFREHATAQQRRARRIRSTPLRASRQKHAPTARVSRSGGGFTTIGHTNLTDCDRRGSLSRSIQSGRLDFTFPCI